MTPSALRTPVVAIPADLLPGIYDQLRELAALYLASRRGTVLQATALVHEAFVRLARSGSSAWNDEAHFGAVIATVMRRVLIDELRRSTRAKRGGDRERVSLEAVEPAADDAPRLDLLALDEALNELAVLSERQARVVELRYFGGLTAAQTAQALGVSPRTVESDWAVARAWLRARLEGRR